MAALVQALRQPATASWCQGRVVAILSHYFINEFDERQAEAVADDWYDCLKPYPAWAVAKACLWWISRKNDYRRRKPIPGDIGARCEVELSFVRVMQKRVAAFDRDGPPVAVAAPKPITPQQREQIAPKISQLAEYNQAMAKMQKEHWKKPRLKRPAELELPGFDEWRRS